MFKAALWMTTLLFLIACDNGDATPSLDASVDGGNDIEDASSGGDASSDGGDIERDYCAPLAALVCGRGSDCGCGKLVPTGTLDTAGCTTRWTQKCLTAYAPYVQAAAAGRARVIKAAARECLTLIETLTPACEQPRGIVSLALCPPFVVSDTQIGKPCGDVPLCAGGEGVCQRGVCSARGQQAATCESEFDCAVGLACIQGSCLPPGGAGSMCGDDNGCAPPHRCIMGSCRVPVGEGKACADSVECAQGLVCDAQKCAAPTGVCDSDERCGPRETCGALRSCETRAAVGTSCTQDRDCTSDLYCDSEGKCAALPGIDQPCANGAGCAAGLSCDPSGAEDARCRALPGNAQPCGLTPDGPFACAAGLGCLDGVCGALPTSGQACAQINLCGPGLACDFTAEGSVCVEPKPTGGACQNEVVCGGTGHCGPDGMCTPNFPDGESCDPNLSECAGACARDTSFGFSCAPKPGLGDACIFGDECPDTLTCRSRLAEATCIPELCELLR